MKPKPEDKPPFDARKMLSTLGPDWRAYPREWWGAKDWAQDERLYEPVGRMPPTPAQAHLPQGFSMFPGHQTARPTAGERAVREIRSAQAKAATSKLDLR